MRGHDSPDWLTEDPRPKVVELAGGPGAGKTTLMPQLIAAVLASGLEPLEADRAGRVLAGRSQPGRLVQRLASGRNRDRALWLIYLVYATLSGVGFVMSRPGLIRVLVNQLRRPPESMVSERHVVRWFIRQAGTERTFRRFAGANEVLLIDEGYVHRVVQLFTSPSERADPATIRRYMALVPEPALLVIVDAPPDIAWARIQSRGVWDRMSHVDEAAVAVFVKHASEAVTCAGRCASDMGWRVTIVENSVDGASPAFDLSGPPTAVDGSDE